MDPDGNKVALWNPKDNAPYSSICCPPVMLYERNLCIMSP
jgi:hypothetical protein